MDEATTTQLLALDEALWAALGTGEGLPVVLVADSLLGCAAAACLSAGLTEQQAVDSLLRALRQLQGTTTLQGVAVLPGTAAEA